MLRRLRTGEAGFTLIELLVGLSLSLIVSSAALDLIPIADSSARGSLTRQAATVAAQTAVERITREARASTAAAVQSPSLLDLNVPLRQPGGGLSTPQHVRYDCSGGHCVRTLCSGAVSGSLVGVGCTPVAAGSELVTGLADANVFAGVLGGSAAPAPVGISPGARSMDQLQITVRIAMAGHAPVEIDDGTSFANFSL